MKLSEIGKKMIKMNHDINVLIITKSPWIETNAFGNTLSNFFGNWQNAKFYNIYCREELPDNNICFSYFNITENQLIKHMLNPKKIGRKSTFSEIDEKIRLQTYNANIDIEKKILDFFRKNSATIFLIFREMLWKIGRWRNKQLDDYLNENKIDIIFAAAADPIYLQDIIIYCKQKTKAKLILFIADDTYSHKTYSPLRYLYQFALRHGIWRSVKDAHKLYGASPKLCEEYSQIFNKEIAPLHKGCSFEDTEIKTSVSSPIKVVYAGNLFYGRWEILKRLAEEIEIVNRDSTKMVLEIYTTATITNEIDVALNRGVSSYIMGSLSYEDIKEVLREADIVLHVESFEPKQIKSTRLSFSTKIIDCMQSGSCMMAIGPRDIASIDYLLNIDGPIVITEQSQIKKELNNIIKHPDTVLSRAMSLREYAVEHHNIDCVHKRLKRDFEGLSNRKICD